MRAVSHIPRFCAHQGWTVPQLLLILPPERSSTDHSLIKLSGREHITFVSTSQLSANSVLSWLHGRILSRVEPIQDMKQLEQVWLNTTHVQEKKVQWICWFVCWFIGLVTSYTVLFLVMWILRYQSSCVLIYASDMFHLMFCCTSLILFYSMISYLQVLWK